ncbi:Fe2+ or Zn2+ uptake regulation protein [Clostridium cavendishii DSM 21758]|uniref:Fe2+ or Zn2+ uptake regulation protein n=1 Tax=Clostridium cavendishii DSM 21758 TaxID=1121302 RepID=A0A1M6CQM7_9CLOT|nr:transcriptional repressor [Clostridium cavendishii]SHI63038.1 Fe2+ or Zn2+ uptake regulation protein [Clostridium cavendishii DSM 21758]
MSDVEFLKSKGIKITKARLVIYDMLKQADSSITADYIYEKCKELGIDINLSTVYRNLEALELKDIIDKFDLGEGRNSFAIKKNKHKHTLECNLCHKEIEVPCPMQQIEEMVRNQTGFVLTEHKLVLKGVCEECKINDGKCKKMTE